MLFGNADERKDASLKRACASPVVPTPNLRFLADKGLPIGCLETSGLTG